MPTRTLRRTPILAPAYYMLLLQSVTDYVACSNAFQGAQLLCALTSAATSNETRTAGCDRHLHPTLSRSDEFDTMATVGALMQFIALLCVIEWVVVEYLNDHKACRQSLVEQVNTRPMRVADVVIV
jgi:hypothetical protein